MFYYYGAKRRLAPSYPAPRFRTIVEPFAGSAGYSMHWLARRRDIRAVLVERDERIVDVWRRLLEMSPRQILGYPIPDRGQLTTDRLIMLAAASNAVGVSSRMTVTRRVQTEARRMLRSAARLRSLIGDRVTVVIGSYSQIDSIGPLRHLDIAATWFIDPPYQAQARSTKTANPGGAGYGPGCRNTDIDYAHLGAWTQTRRGQVIACENVGATWLPFESMQAHSNTIGRSTREAVWLSEPSVQRSFAFDT